MTITVRDDTLKGAARRARELSPAWRRVRREYERTIAAQFASEGALLSGGWSPLDPAYASSKAQAGLDGRILHATNRMRDDFVSSGFFRPTATSVELGATSEIAVYHQFGTSKMVARPIITPRIFDYMDVAGAVLDHIMGRSG